MNFFTELVNRVSAKSPIFHRKLQKFGAWLGGAGLALILIPSSLEGIDLSFISENVISLISKVGSYMFLAGAVIGAVAGTAVLNPDYTTLDKKG